jgi:hypothetical protein
MRHDQIGHLECDAWSLSVTFKNRIGGFVRTEPTVASGNIP